MNNKFSWQSFISIGLLFSFVIMLLSGIVLYIAPEGSLSRWIAWDVLGLSKKQWEHQHTIFSYLFVLFSIFHVFKINYVLLLSYFVPEKMKIWNYKEILIAVFISVVVFIGTLLSWSPFTSVLKLGASISDKHEVNVDMPDYPDAEKLTLLLFSELVMESSFAEVERALINVELKNIEKKLSVEEFCHLNNISPEEFIKILRGELSKIKRDIKIDSSEIKSTSGFVNNN